MRLSDLKTGESATVLKVSGHGGFRRRIMEMGFVRGQRVEVKLNAPLRDPIEYRIMGYDVSLRRSEAEMISVITNEEAERRILENHDGTNVDTTNITEIISRSSKHISVALVGNPNSGKTSLFNAISGSHEHVGNYSGVTVDAKLGRCNYKGYSFEITDLPGTYALSAYSPEEIYVRKHLADRTPDVIINAVVASNLERNLYLTTELIDINPRMVVALNMYDELTASGARLDYENLGAMLGVPMVPVVAKTRYGIEQLLDTVIAVFENEDSRVRHIHINHGSVVEEGLQRLDDRLRDRRDELPKQFPPRYYAMKLLEGDREVERMLHGIAEYDEWIALRDSEARRIEAQLGEDVETAFANQKYGFISGALRETYTPGHNDRADITEAIDLLVTHRVWGFPIFFLVMWFMFYCTFNVGAYPQKWIETLVEYAGSLGGGMIPAGALHDLVIDGIVGGVGSVIVFLPNIVILYLFISFMEDSGYLARAAFIMDKVMHRIGLHGKSFIPLIMGFGCNVPAIMATRTIESRSSRLITLLILPFMSCSARLPIYILIAGTFFPHHAGMMLFVLYVLGVGVAVVTARHIMRRFMFPVDETPFVMELPPYRVPTLRTKLIHMGDLS
ncbi:MAG: ferrous iron transport protein B, partial [Alistipes sp.]|nr:ferrous iron transport protein B [Alistipes sp.]